MYNQKKVVEIIGGEPVVKFVKGDLPGHEFRGNQYRDGSEGNAGKAQDLARNGGTIAKRNAFKATAEANRASQTGSKNAADKHWDAHDAHLKAAESVKNDPRMQGHHMAAAEAHKKSAGK